MLPFETKILFRHAHSLNLFHHARRVGSPTTLSSVANKHPNHTQIQNQSKTNPKPIQNQPMLLFIPYNIHSTSKHKLTLLAGKSKTATNRPETLTKI